jgi:hypothetical protein
MEGPAKYHAPSWSWASIEGPVELNLKVNLMILRQEVYRGSEPAQKFRLLEAKVEVDGFDLFSEVSGGYLKLSAGLRQITICERDWIIDTLSDDNGKSSDFKRDTGGSYI